MNLIKKVFFSSLITITSINVNAELLSVDFQNEGDNYVTLDTQSGLEWLDFSFTRNDKYRDYYNGGYGFRIPTNAEVEALFTNNISSVDDPYVSGLIYPDGDTSDIAWLNLLLGTAWVTPYPSLYYSYGFYKDEDGDMALFGSHHTNAIYGLDNKSYFGDSDYSHKYGILLVSDGGVTYSSLNDPTINTGVSDASVPLPASLGLLALSMLGFGARRKSK